MRTDAQNRIMSLSFRREPKEHADVMLQAGRRLMTPRNSSYGWTVFIGAVAFGAVIGITMEVYRRFVLSPLLGIDEVTPLNIIILQLLPFLLLIFALLYARARDVSKRRKQALIDRLEPGLFVDTDIFRDGLRSSTGPLTITMEWTAVRNVLIDKTRIELEGESFSTYIPERAFENRPAFEAAAAQIRTLWQDAKRKQKQIAEGAAASGGEILTTRH